jgi:uncharacterized membrane protein YfcA
VHVHWIILVGLFSGLMAGLFGIGGNFITIPTLIFMGISPTIALSSAVNQTIASSFSSFLNHWKKNNVDIEIGLYLFIGGLIGTISGSLTFKYLKGAGYMDVVIFLIYIVVLGTMGTILSVESFQKIFFKKNKKIQKKKTKKSSIFKMLPLKKEFKTANVEISIIAILILGAFIGYLVSLSGIGGGFILVPTLIYAFAIPTTIAIGTSVFQAVFTTIIVTFLHATTVKTVDVMLAFLLTLGALIGVNMGIRISAKLKPEMLRGLLALVILFGFFRLIITLFVTPGDLYSFTIIK